MYDFVFCLCVAFKFFSVVMLVVAFAVDTIVKGNEFCCYFLSHVQWVVFNGYNIFKGRKKIWMLPLTTSPLCRCHLILKDEKARNVFHDFIRVKHQKLLRQSQQDLRRKQMMSDLEERERSAFAAHDRFAKAFKATSEEENVARKLKEEISKIRAMHANKFPPKVELEKQLAWVLMQRIRRIC
ncbi:hypothetical protein QVD17_05049 [Tagetes erecta]|uniref:Uncharacterized protein n=1 Tax=Tagetes erecta TaxID=13708 RepID=A0AAD8PA76_TARER|nr:hypothetical protein QVD17_05049 [Tagetes erecta]